MFSLQPYAMKSILLLCVVVGAISNPSTCEGDETTLLQGRNLVRASKLKTDDPYGFEFTLANVAEQRALLLQQIETAQQQIGDAIKVFQGCENIQQAMLEEQLEERAVDAEDCHTTLDELRTAESQACNRAEDCLCEEARQATTDQVALCESKTETYEVAFCAHRAVCTTSRSCHRNEADAFRLVRAAVEAEIQSLVLSYTMNERTGCRTRLQMEAHTPPVTEVDRAAMNACHDVDVSELVIDYPEEPTEPAACPTPAYGHPECPPVLVMKTVTDLLEYDNPLWENTETLNPSSPVDEEIDAKYQTFMISRFNTIILCVGGPTERCITHPLQDTYESAHALFTAGFIRDTTIDQTTWLTNFEAGSAENVLCPMQRPGFNSQGRDNNKARFGWLNNVGGQSCQSGDNQDADGAIGIGLHGQGGEGGGGTGAGHTNGFTFQSCRRCIISNVSFTIPTWVYVQEV